MSVNLPPQAYTRDVLGQAYEWLQNQPPKIRELATSMDAMVTLYLQHRRRGDSAPVSTTPISSQKFKEDLQTLANGIKQFDEAPVSNTYIPQPPAAPSIKEPTIKAPQAAAQTPKLSTIGLENLDARTLESLELVRKSLNLSSHEEALRMLVELGLARVKEFLPKS